MRLLGILIVLLLEGVSFAQLTSSTDERTLPGEIKRTAETPTILAAKRSLTFIEFTVIFDGGSYGARFRRDDGEHLIIYFLHAGYWSKRAITNGTQPIVVELSHEKQDKVRLEVEPKSAFEKRLLELLDNDLSNKDHSSAQIKTLTRLRDCIADRKPLAEIRKQLPTRPQK